MGKLINVLRQLVKEEINKTANQSLVLKVTDVDKAERVKKLHPNHWVSKLIDILIDAGEKGITRHEAADILDMNPMKLNDEIKALQDNEIISRGRLTPEKPISSGKRSNDKSKAGIIRALYQNWTDNPDYEPSEEDITYNIPKGLGTEKLEDREVLKVKGSALGTHTRGRPASGKDKLLSKVEKALQKESLDKKYRRLQSI